MDPTAAHDLLHDVENVRQRARGDRRATSVPLLAFGALTILDALLRRVTDPLGNVAFWLLAPVGFALVALYYWRREIGTGVGRKSTSYVVAALATVLFVPFVAVLGAYALTGLGLFVIALRQRNRYLGAWAVGYAVVGGLESIFFFSNRLFDVSQALGVNSGAGGDFPWSSSLVYGVLGLALVAAGLHAWRREVASA